MGYIKYKFSKLGNYVKITDGNNVPLYYIPVNSATLTKLDDSHFEFNMSGDNIAQKIDWTDVVLPHYSGFANIDLFLDALSPIFTSIIGGGGGGGGTFTQNITVSLSGGKTLGKYTNGQTIPSAGQTFEDVMRDIAIEDIAPTYTPATLSLTDSVANQDEVGTAYNNNLLATFTQNDAGILTQIRIQKNGSDMLPNGVLSPLPKNDVGTYPLGSITYVAYANYNAGIIKNYLPSGTPDPRPALIRNVNAPQAAENNFASNTVTLTGFYKIFYGPTASAPANSANVRALPSNQLTNAGNVFILNTGAVQNIFAVAIPATMSLVSVIDLDALNANITANYVLTTFNVNDAGGNPVAYKIYIMTNAVPYSSNHRHQITVA